MKQSWSQSDRNIFRTVTGFFMPEPFMRGEAWCAVCIHAYTNTPSSNEWKFEQQSKTRAVEKWKRRAQRTLNLLERGHLTEFRHVLWIISFAGSKTKQVRRVGTKTERENLLNPESPPQRVLNLARWDEMWHIKILKNTILKLPLISINLTRSYYGYFSSASST